MKEKVQRGMVRAYLAYKRAIFQYEGIAHDGVYRRHWVGALFASYSVQSL